MRGEGSAQPAQFRHRVPLRVRWSESDQQAVVFNGHYLSYADVCITEYWRALGLAYPAGVQRWGSDFFVRRATLDYHASARYDDELELCGRVAQIGRTSLRIEVAIHRRGEARPLVVCELTYVNVGIASGRPQPWPEELLTLIRDFEPAAPKETAREPHA